MVNKIFDFVLFLFGMFLLSRPLGFTLHFLWIKLDCCKTKASSVALQHPCTVSTSTQSTVTHGPRRDFCHTLPSVTARGDAHTLCVLLSPHAAILAGNQRSSSAQPLAATFVELRSPGDSRACPVVLSAPLRT